MTPDSVSLELKPNTKAKNKNNWRWLIAGIIVTTLVGNRFNVAILGWVATVPWLVYLRRSSGWRSQVALFLAVQLGTFIQMLKIITEPIPWFFAAMFSVPSAAFGFLLLLLFEASRRRLGDAWGLILFPAITIVSEWVAATYSGMGSWGALAYSQLDNLALLQLTSLFGLTGVSMVLASTSALTAVLIDSQARARWRRATYAIGALVVAAHIFGAIRIYTPLPGPLVTVATVSTDIGIGADGLLPSADQLATANNALFSRTEKAMEQGAALVVWNEGSTAVPAAEEDAFIARGQALAQAHQADVVLAYVVPIDGMKRFENKYLWLSPSGPLETYFKHHPVPGEGAIASTDPIRVFSRPYGNAAGAICYDYDYPGLAHQHALGGAGIVAVPSSDWRGIDPFHTQMARVRGIEGGFSVVRSVRWATSAAYDALGRPRASSGYFEGERVMIARLPTQQIPTLYNQIGDVLPFAAFIVLLIASGFLFRQRRRTDVEKV